MPYPVAACRGHGVPPVAIPWYLEGGVSAANCMAAYQPKGAADIATSYVNLANPGTNNAAAPVAAPTFDTSTGWTFNGSTQYLVTGYIPNDNAAFSGIIRFVYTSGGFPDQSLFGQHAASSPYNGVFVRPVSSTSSRSYANDGSVVVAGNATGARVMAVAGRQGYLDGSADGTAFSGVAQALQAYDLYIGALHYSSTIQHAKVSIQAIAFYDIALSDAQVLAISTAMAAL